MDVAGKEDTEGELDIPIAYYPKKKEITLLQMDGLTNKKELKEIMALAIKGCEQIYKKQQEALREKKLNSHIGLRINLMIEDWR